MKRLLILSAMVSILSLAGSSVAYAANGTSGSGGGQGNGNSTVAVCETDPKTGDTYTLYVSPKGAAGKIAEGLAVGGAC